MNIVESAGRPCGVPVVKSGSTLAHVEYQLAAADCTASVSYVHSRRIRQGRVVGLASRPSSPSASEAFYAPSGNVTCSLQSESAECSVASVDMTFVLPQGGGSAYTIGGLSVPRGEGSEAPFDTERTDGEIVCSIPPENVPAGITCRNTTTGHGFEASRVYSRQKVY